MALIYNSLVVTGSVIGRFYPFHAGHQYVIETALSKVDFLTILVEGRRGQIIKPEIRANWVRDIYPQAKVKVVYHNLESEDDAGWAKNTLKWLGYKPDLVFTSENYGDHYARLMGAVHIPVDIPRKKFPISGTAIRLNPLLHFEYLHPIVRAYFVRRMCFVGAESVGKTTMAQLLAKKFKTSWVPEFGRYYTEGKVTSKFSEWESRELQFIARVQNNLEDELAGYANKVLFCDTNSLATYVWEELLVGKGSVEVEGLFKKMNYALYMVCDIDVDFVADNVRVAKKQREWMHRRFIELLEKYKLPYIIVSGSLKNRISVCEQKVNEILDNYRVEEKIL